MSHEPGSICRRNAPGALEVALADTRERAAAIRGGSGLCASSEFSAEVEALRLHALAARLPDQFEVLSREPDAFGLSEQNPCSHSERGFCFPMSTLPDYPFPVKSVRGERVEEEILRMRQDAAGSNTVPVIIGDRESALRLLDVWDDPFDHEAVLAAAAEFSVKTWLARRREEDGEMSDDESLMEIHPGGTAPMTQLTVGYDFNGKANPEIFIATLPTDDPCAIPVLLRFGNWNACPAPEEHMGMALYWAERYGAEIATVTSDVVEYTVTRPPQSDAEALELAWEQYLYCADIVDQGVGSVATLAQALRHSTRWYFWWD